MTERDGGAGFHVRLGLIGTRNDALGPARISTTYLILRGDSPTVTFRSAQARLTMAVCSSSVRGDAGGANWQLKMGHAMIPR